MNKRLNEMDDLRDMGRFPPSIYLGATGNILLTIVLTYLVRGRCPRPFALPVWAGSIISLNVLPVFLLRSRTDESTHYSLIREMDFFTDQHKFSNWVYAVASANTLFWIVLAWSLFILPPRRKNARRDTPPGLRLHLLPGVGASVSTPRLSRATGATG